jgi:hypothetical protein
MPDNLRVFLSQLGSRASNRLRISLRDNHEWFFASDNLRPGSAVFGSNEIVIETTLAPERIVERCRQ